MKFAALFLFFAVSSFATTITLGTQEWTNGTALSTGAFNSGSTGEPAPFNAFIGSDTIPNSNFSASWTFNYTPVTTVSSSTLTVSIYDLDSSATGSQIQSFTLNGINLTSNLNTVSEAANATTGIISILTLTLPATTYAALETGTATFSLTLQNGEGVIGPTASNGAGLDFSTLDFTSQGATPEPSTFLSMGSALAALGLWLRLRRA